jgi:hypothetical protein
VKTVHPGPWVPLCQSCWERIAPDQYFPDAMYIKECFVCKRYSMTGHIRKSEVDAYKAEMRDRYGDADDSLRSYAN